MPFWKKKKSDIPDTSDETKDEMPIFRHELNANDTISQYLKCLFEIFDEGNINQHKLNRIYRSVETLDVSDGEIILNYGEDGKGIYIILLGRVEVLDKVDDELIIINEKYQGDYFGEVSTLFDIKITASIRSASRCRLLFLSKDVCGQLFQKPAKTLIDWFVQKKYLPTRIPGLEGGRVIRRHVLQVLSKLTLLWCWEEESVKTIILSKKSDLIRVYPPSSALLLHGDPVNHLLIVLTGSVILKPKDTRHGFCIETTPVVVGETDYFRRNNSSISVHAKTYCQVLVLDRTTLDDSLHWIGDYNIHLEWTNNEQNFQKFGQDRRTKFLPRSLSCYKHFEVLHSKVSSSTAFKSTSPIFTYTITLKSQFIVISARQTLEITSEFGLMQVIHGLVLIYYKSVGRVRKLILKEGELVWCNKIKYMKNPDHSDVLIIQYSKPCLQSAVQYCTDTDKQNSLIKDIIDNYSQHKLQDV